MSSNRKLDTSDADPNGSFFQDFRSPKSTIPVKEDFVIGITSSHAFSKELSEAEFMAYRNKDDSISRVPESDL
jgi:hypothetical protein